VALGEGGDMSAYIPRDDSYATYEGFDDIPYNCYKYLMDHDEMIWKLIKYNTPDAWNQSNLTREEKGALIYHGQDDLTTSRAFFTTKLPDVWTQEICIIRISPYSIFPENKVYGTVSILFDVSCHWKVESLSDYRSRLDVVAQRFLATFNGATLPGLLGKLYFDRSASEGVRLEQGGQTPFGTRWMVMSNKSV
jgi:hypothetical protein